MGWLVGDDGAMADGCETGPVCKEKETHPKFTLGGLACESNFGRRSVT